MADKVDPRTGELTTANYGWVKPTVGASVDAWGGYLNTDLDGIDSVVHGIQTSVPAASSTTPAMDGTAAVGTGATFARADHVHPSDTTKYSTTNPSGYQTAAQVTTSLGPYALIASPTFTGTPAAPTASPGTNTTQLATTAFVSAMPVAIGDNRIINGDMRIDQRNNGASGTAGQYTVDRWSYGASVVNKGTWGRQLNAPPPSEGFPYSLTFVSNSSYALAASDQFIFYQPIEADQIGDFQFGTANAKPVTLSFWVYASVSGTFSGALQNYTQTRAYPFSYSVPAINTWTKIAVTIPGDTGGTWVMSGSGGSLFVIFDLGSGATLRGPANAWASASYNGVTGAKSIVSTSGATFYLTGVKLEVGAVATPYNRQSLAKSMADCQRYYEVGGAAMFSGNVTSGASTGYYACVVFKANKRAAPTIVCSDQGSLSFPAGSPSAAGLIYSDSFMATKNANATGAAYFQFGWTASAEL